MYCLRVGSLRSESAATSRTAVAVGVDPLGPLAAIAAVIALLVKYSGSTGVIELQPVFGKIESPIRAGRRGSAKPTHLVIPCVAADQRVPPPLIAAVIEPDRSRSICTLGHLPAAAVDAPPSPLTSTLKKNRSEVSDEERCNRRSEDRLTADDMKDLTKRTRFMKQTKVTAVYHMPACLLQCGALVVVLREAFCRSPVLGCAVANFWHCTGRV